jgi:uncharacterized membrane protein YeaQ/YmgE (transglycosylase-associated protein family)
MSSRDLPTINSLRSMEEKYRRQGTARLIKMILGIIGSPFILGWILYYWQFDRLVSRGELTRDQFVRACIA